MFKCTSISGIFAYYGKERTDIYENKINKIAWKADEQEYIRCVEYHAPRDWYYVSLRNIHKKIHCEEPYQKFKWF